MRSAVFPLFFLIFLSSFHVRQTGGKAPPPPALAHSKAPFPGDAIAAAAAAAASRRAAAGHEEPAAAAPKAGGGGMGLNMQEVLAQRNRLRKVEKPEGGEEPKKAPLDANVKGLIKHGVCVCVCVCVRVRVRVRACVCVWKWLDIVLANTES
jgi:hypothetical protein